MKPLWTNSQRPWRKGWQLVWSTERPRGGPDVSQEEAERDLPGQRAQVAIAPRGGHAAVPARESSRSPYQPRPEAVRVGLAAGQTGVPALLNEGVRRVEQEPLEPIGVTVVREPTAHGQRI